MKRITYLIFPLSLSLLMSSCAMIFLPKKQKISLNATNSESKVFLNDEQIGKGETTVTKVERSGTQQVVTQTPGYKDEYSVLFPQGRVPMYVPLRLLSFAFFILPGYMETYMVYGMDKKFNYNKVNNVSNKIKITTRGDLKYVNLEAIELNMKDKTKDFYVISVPYKPDVTAAIKTAEEAYEKQKAKEAKKEEKKRAKKGAGLIEEGENPNDLKYDNTSFTQKIAKTLVKSNFVDTVNKVFQDDLNTVNLVGTIKKSTIFGISKSGFEYNKVRLKIVWKMRNNYGEVLDSITREDFSGDFRIPSSYVNKDEFEKKIELMFADAVDVSFQRMLSDAKFQKFLKPETYKNPYASNFMDIARPKSVVKSVEDGLEASVIVKRKDKGHGSGFAITNDGYILTNYHVIAGDKLDKYADFKIVVPNGEEVNANVVRVNRSKDVALLKIDAKFDKVFSIGSEKTFKRLQEVYCIGTPKSLELGQTVTMGILSNERNVNNNSVLQLSMSINQGNSGGPLFGKDGALIGVIQSKLVGYSTEGIGFAIPSYQLGDYLGIRYR